MVGAMSSSAPVAAWTNSATTRATRARKLVFVDSGVCAHLAGITTERAKRDQTRAGSLIENFVIGEIMRQLSWSNSFARAYHYRTRDGEEVAKRLTNSFALGSGVEIGRGSGPSVVAFGRTRMPPSRPTRWRARASTTASSTAIAAPWPRNGVIGRTHPMRFISSPPRSG